MIKIINIIKRNLDDYNIIAKLKNYSVSGGGKPRDFVILLNHYQTLRKLYEKINVLYAILTCFFNLFNFFIQFINFFYHALFV